MRIFVYGGSGSGKSEFAERAILDFGDAARRLYVATMQPHGEDAARRIARHRAKRADKGFETVECLGRLTPPVEMADAAVLLECVGNLVANLMFSAVKPNGDAGAMALRDIEALGGRARHLVLVSNDVMTDGVRYPPETEAYRLALAGVNRALAASSEVVVEMVCGIPIYHKKECL